MSKEWFEYHLTPGGWIEGTKSIDFSSIIEKPIPKDRVISIRGHEELTHVRSKPYCCVSVIWKSENDGQVKVLVEKFGKLPKGTSHWGDYNL